jgi:hypothetical protein
MPTQITINNSNPQYRIMSSPGGGGGEEGSPVSISFGAFIHQYSGFNSIGAVIHQYSG